MISKRRTVKKSSWLFWILQKIETYQNRVWIWKNLCSSRNFFQAKTSKSPVNFFVSYRRKITRKIETYQNRVWNWKITSKPKRLNVPLAFLNSSKDNYQKNRYQNHAWVWKNVLIKKLIPSQIAKSSVKYHFWSWRRKITRKIEIELGSGKYC